MMYDTPHWLKCLHERFTSSTCYPRCAVVRSLTLLFLALFLSVSLSYPLLFTFHFYLNPDLNLFLHVVDTRASNHWHSANWGVWPLDRKHPSHTISGAFQRSGHLMDKIDRYTLDEQRGGKLAVFVSTRMVFSRVVILSFWLSCAQCFSLSCTAVYSCSTLTVFWPCMAARR